MSETPTRRTERTTTGANGATNRPSSGARAVADEPHRKRRMGWLWWLLGLLALAAIVALVVGLVGGDDHGKNAQDPAGQAGNATAGGATSTAGSMTAGGMKLLPVPSGGLRDAAGQNAVGRDVVVQSVVKDQQNPDQLNGFWVGSSAQDRVYVEWGGDVGPDEADYRPKVGEKVNVTGPVRPAPRNPERALNLSAADAKLVRTQGAFVNADEVRPAGG